MQQCNSVIIYGTKTGVELTSMGIPVIVAGEAWIRNKGITLDASSLDEYYKILDQLPLNDKITGEKLIRARKYAFHFFFRRMIPVESIRPSGRSSLIRIKKKVLDSLMAKDDIGLNVICDGILNGTDFVYRDESRIRSQ